MTTILAVGNSERTRRCDAKCHDAREPECDCICRGRYHGKGREAQQLLQDDALKGSLGPELKEAVSAAVRPFVGQESLNGVQG